MSPRRALFDCFSGIAGDMTLAALFDAGASQERVLEGLQRLGLPPFRLRSERVQRAGLEALHVDVVVSEEHTFQPPEIEALIVEAGLPERVTERSLAAVAALAAGEASAHRTETPALHEAGGVDAVIDIVGTMLALEDLDIAEAHCPVVTVGAGTITRSAHGAIPASPGPAAAAILERACFALRFVEAAHEFVTPTGAAILAAVAAPGPTTITPRRHGVGAGRFDPADRPNALRIFVGEVPEDAGAVPSTRALTLLEANIDDMPATLIALARERLLGAGARDAWTESIGMKKARPATKLCALVAAGEEARFAAIFAQETTTLGVRTTPYERFEADRTIEPFASSLGSVRVKRSSWFGVARATPEPDDIAALAQRHGRAALEVQRQLERELADAARPPDGA